jgi:predicted chitinase
MPTETSSQFDPATSALTAAVGPGQPNNRDDVITIQNLLNIVVGTKSGTALDGGAYDAKMQEAIRTFERFYSNGVARSFEPNGDAFAALKSAAILTKAIFSPNLANEMYQLSSIMVPGGADRLLKGKPRQDGRIRKYLPFILQELQNRKLGDLDMLLMALATIRAETSGFDPISEGIYGGHWDLKRNKWIPGNTTMVKEAQPKDPLHPKDTKTPASRTYDRYDNMKSLGNTGCHVDPAGKNWCDGERYRGRGFCQLTGRTNYERIGRQIGVNLVDDPDKALDAAVAAKILAQFLKNDETAIRDALKWGNLPLARKKVNGGSNGLSEFTTSFNAGRNYLHMAVVLRAQKPATQKKAPPRLTIVASRKTAGVR